MSKSTLELDAVCIDLTDILEPNSQKRGPQSRTHRVEGAGVGSLIGKLASFSEAGEAMVEVPGDSAMRPVPARSTVTLCDKDIGREVLLVFEGQDRNRPVVIGLIQAPARRSRRNLPPAAADTPTGRTLVLRAEDEIVLSCGEASITLTKAGKIIVHGTYLVSRSSGVNSIKGGSVQIN